MIAVALFTNKTVFCISVNVVLLSWQDNCAVSTQVSAKVTSRLFTCLSNRQGKRFEWKRRQSFV